MIPPVPFPGETPPQPGRATTGPFQGNTIKGVPIFLPGQATIETGVGAEAGAARGIGGGAGAEDVLDRLNHSLDSGGGQTMEVYDPAQGFQATASASMMSSVPGQLYRPNMIASGKPDIRHNPNPDAGDLRDYNAESPGVLRAEAFGAQGGNWVNAGSGIYTVDQRATDGQFQYTQNPCQGRYANGTAGGGLVFMAPEVDLADNLRSTPFASPEITQSTSYITVVSNSGSGVWWAAGRPELIKGTIYQGYSWGVDSSGNMLFRIHDATANIDGSNQIRFSTVGDIAFRSSTNFWGEFQHAITANRTWIWPDKSGTVALLDDITGGMDEAWVMAMGAM